MELIPGKTHDVPWKLYTFLLLTANSFIVLMMVEVVVMVLMVMVMIVVVVVMLGVMTDPAEMTLPST